MRICVAYPTVKGVSGGGLRTMSCVIFIKQKRQPSRSVSVTESWGVWWFFLKECADST